MKLGWMLFQYAPPDLTLTPAQKREARRRTWHAYHTTPSSLLISLATATVLGLLFSGAILLLDRHFAGDFQRISLFVATLTLLGITWIVNAFAGRWIYGRAHRQALREMGFEVCMKCGYWLRGLPALPQVAHCPECGALREPLPGAGEVAP